MPRTLTAEERLLKQDPLMRVRSNLYREMYGMGVCPCVLKCDHEFGDKLEAYDKAVAAFEAAVRRQVTG